VISKPRRGVVDVKYVAEKLGVAGQGNEKREGLLRSAYHATID
jgi:hypothetical protein